MRLIPGKTKVQIELFRGITLGDILIALVAAILVAFVLISTLPAKLLIILGVIFLAAILLVRLDSEPNYIYLLHILRNLAYKRKFARRVSDAELCGRAAENAGQKKSTGKRYDMSEIVGFTAIRDDMIEYGGEYYGAALEISPVEFRFFSETRRTNSVENSVGRILRALPSEYAANIVKIERPVMFDAFLESEQKKVDAIRYSYERGMITEEEFKARFEIICDRMDELQRMSTSNKVVQPFYYVVFFDSDKNQLANAVSSAIDTFRAGEIDARRLGTKELAVFLKYTNRLDFDEKEIESVDPSRYAEWAMPEELSVQARVAVVDGIYTHNLRISSYPSQVDDAWLAAVMSMPSTKVVVKCKPMDREKTVRSIDRALQELRGQFMTTGVDSKRIELQEHIDTLSTLLSTLQSDNEVLLETNVYVTAYDVVTSRNYHSAAAENSAHTSVNYMKRVVRRAYQENGLRLNNMEFDQVNAFIGSQISAWDPLGSKGRGIPANTVAAAYPWIFAHIADPNGIRLGSADGVPVFIDFFKRDSEHVNSNMVIVGKSGSGKSYAAKSLLANLAADDAKIFILDPENEYTELADNLHGKFINVGNAQQGRLNPFHIITALDDDETDSVGVSGSYATHLQFLEEFFRQILPDCDKDAMEYLNSLIDRMYTDRGITAETDLSRLAPEDYPTFDDLYDAILSEFQSTDNDYVRPMLRTLMNYVAKFAAGGRNANIWNGPSTVTTDENFTVFNFQSLLANRNGSIANAQMLLVLKYIDNEIIKNRDYNLKYKLNRKIVVVIDEAHVFIDTKYPVALDFMYQLAKRIRKYNGMQIVITQNIKDFVGSEEIARKSTAIINACQYSFIFALAPNDMGDLCKLYEKAGGINESEQEQIVSAGRGQAFTVLSPQSRSSFKVEVSPDVVDMFRHSGCVSRYFSGEDGQRVWEDFLGESRAKHDEAIAQRSHDAESAPAGTKTGRFVCFTEIDGDDFDEGNSTAGGIAAAPETKHVTLTEKAETPAAPAARTAPAAERVITPNVVIQAPAASSETERLLGDLLDRFSYETMMQEVRRAVREEMEKEYAGRIAPAAEPEKPEVSEKPEPEKKEPEKVAPQPAPGLGGMTVSAAPAEPAAPAFDIMSLLLREAELGGTSSPIDKMEEYNEHTVDISLEELMRYNTEHK
ncbi:MAG: DUF87 domain-containing protein [Clostridia bacterium]|nr:DUF87 domain-containing protein [Clostridia bacterium]